LPGNGAEDPQGDPRPRRTHEPPGRGLPEWQEVSPRPWAHRLDSSAQGRALPKEETIMSTEPTGGSRDAEVVPLRAADAHTEARVAGSPGPAYADLSDGRAQRKPVIPAHWRTREAAREHVRLAAARHGHAAAYHGVRVPAYLVLTTWWALAGLVRTVALLLAWWHVPDLHKLDRQAAADGLLSDHLRIHKAREETRPARRLILA